MLTRRELLSGTTLLGTAALLSAGGRCRPRPGVLVNDRHSQLNATWIHQIIKPRSIEEIRNTLRHAQRQGRTVSAAGGRHAMGGQQFDRNAILLDMTEFNRILQFDPDSGTVDVQSGVNWPKLITDLLRMQRGGAGQWGIRQKQTGADRLSIGGSLAANVHGRGLCFKPLVADVESFELVDAAGNMHACSRQTNRQLFRLAIGGYGLFGIIGNVRLRLMPRIKLRRVVEVIDVDDLMPAFQQRIREGYLYGDFQYATDSRSDAFLRRGVLSCYHPVPDDTPIPKERKELSPEDWGTLYRLAHTDRSQAFQRYCEHYLATSGQIYWSDTHQLSPYIDNYHKALDKQLGARHRATEMITEVYVPRHELASFLDDVREDFRRHNVELIYGTIRLIEGDDESFLAWAKRPYACIVFNLHVVHTEQGLKKGAADFRRLIDRAIQYKGSYFLTYHRWATRKQLETCYPQFAEFLRLKRTYDPDERFQSTWYRHYRRLLDDEL